MFIYDNITDGQWDKHIKSIVQNLTKLSASYLRVYLNIWIMGCGVGKDGQPEVAVNWSFL